MFERLRDWWDNRDLNTGATLIVNQKYIEGYQKGRRRGAVGGAAVGALAALFLAGGAGYWLYRSEQSSADFRHQVHAHLAGVGVGVADSDSSQDVAEGVGTLASRYLHNVPSAAICDKLKINGSTLTYGQAANAAQHDRIIPEGTNTSSYVHRSTCDEQVRAARDAGLQEAPAAQPLAPEGPQGSTNVTGAANLDALCAGLVDQGARQERGKYAGAVPKNDHDQQLAAAYQRGKAEGQAVPGPVPALPPAVPESAQDLEARCSASGMVHLAKGTLLLTPPQIDNLKLEQFHAGRASVKPENVCPRAGYTQKGKPVADPCAGYGVVDLNNNGTACDEYEGACLARVDQLKKELEEQVGKTMNAPIRQAVSEWNIFRTYVMEGNECEVMTIVDRHMQLNGKPLGAATFAYKGSLESLFADIIGETARQAQRVIYGPNGQVLGDAPEYLETRAAFVEKAPAWLKLSDLPAGDKILRLNYTSEAIAACQK